MKVVLMLCGALLVIVFVLACSKRKSAGASRLSVASARQEVASVLNYDEMVMLDAEDLGEGGIASMYRKDVVPLLKKYIATPATIVEDHKAEAQSYTVASQGKTYVIFSPDTKVDHGENWGNATYALFDIVNRQLQNSPYKFYAINGGNDLGGMFLNKETYDKAVESLKRKQDRPYLPTTEPPWYGQPHDD